MGLWEFVYLLLYQKICIILHNPVNKLCVRKEMLVYTYFWFISK
nr:MAG TPA: hypothetical protein [Caudoviricetes sp.]